MSTTMMMRRIVPIPMYTACSFPAPPAVHVQAGSGGI
jgi:hypothetical protein